MSDDARVKLQVNEIGLSAIDAFVEYRRIVGDDDVLMSQDEFEVCCKIQSFDDVVVILPITCVNIAEIQGAHAADPAQKPPVRQLGPRGRQPRLQGGAIHSWRCFDPVMAMTSLQLVGPETACFCGHRYRQHQTDFEHVDKAMDLQLPCKVKGCRCATYVYVPHISGSMQVPP